MRAVIYERREIENGSLLLKTLGESGKIKNFKIPGILKSKTRNSYFLAPATLWEFTLAGNDREVVTPKEYSLVHAPYDFNTGYRELTRIRELLNPLAGLKPGLEIAPLFDDIVQTLYDWHCGDEVLENVLINRFYLGFLRHMGLLHYLPECVHCGAVLGETAQYHLFSGSICTTCLRRQIYRENEFLPNRWIRDCLENPPANGIFSREQESAFRQKILNFLKIST